MLCISTKERKHVSQSNKRRRPPIEINLQMYRYRSESESVRSPSRKDEHTLYRLPACVRCPSSSNGNTNSNSIDYRTRRSHDNDLTSAYYQRKNKNKNTCRVYTRCSCCIQKTPHYTQNEIVHVKLLNAHSPCSRKKSPCTSSIRVVRSLPQGKKRS